MKYGYFGFCCGLLLGTTSIAWADIPAGTTENGGSVARGTVQNVYGTAIDFSVNGTQNIMSGGNSQYTALYSSGQQIVNSGGYALATQVNNNAAQTVLGKAEQTLINYGQQVVADGGTALNSTVKYGTITVQTGGTAQGTNVSYRGVENVSGLDISSTINSRGTQNVMSGGQAQNTTINSGGNQYVYAGGVSSGTIINGGYQLVEGEAQNTVMYDGSQVVDGGTLDGAVVNGYGGLSFSSGGKGNNLSLNDEGSIMAFSGTKISDVTVNSGYLLVEGQAEMNNLTQFGGSTLLENGAVVSGVTKLSGGEFKVQGANTIPVLEMNNATVDMINDNQYAKLTIENISGQGNFYLNSQAAASQSDELVINGGSGNFGIAMVDSSYEEIFPQNIPIVDVAGGKAQFYLLGGAVDVGAYQYDLHHIGDEWILEKTSQLTDTAILTKNTYSAINSVFLAQMETMNNRFDDLHLYKDSGFWIKTGWRNLKLNFKDSTESDADVTTIQAGYDMKIKQDLVDTMMVGFSAGFSDSLIEFDRSGKAKGDTLNVGLYSSLMTQDKYFLDLMAHYYWHSQKLKSFLPHGDDVDGKYDVNGWSVGAEVGKKLDLANGWFAEPHLKLKYIDLGSMEYRTTLNTRIKGKGATSLEGRVGASAGYTWDDKEVYAEFNLVEEFDGKSKIDVAGETLHEDISDTMYELGAGFKFQPREDLYSYVSVSTQLGDKIEVPIDVNFGLRYEF